MAKFSWNDYPDVPASTTQGAPAPAAGVNMAPTTGQTGPATGAQTQTGTDPNTWTGVQHQIAEAFIRQGIQPTEQLVGQWGSNIDANYLATILRQIGTLPHGDWTPPGATTTPAASTPAAPAGPRDFGDLTDPKTWMNLVGNRADLIAWIKQNNPSISDSLADYYAGKIQAQPGANENEQKGSAGYWLGKMKDDPELGGKGSGVPGTPGNQEFSYPNWNETFQAPSGLTEQNDPGWQARMQLGTDALQRSAAAKGSVLDTGTLKDINKYAQDYATNEYANVYNRAAGEYNQRYGQYQTGFQNALTAFGTNFGVDQSLWNRALTQEQTGWAQQMDLANLGLAGNAGSSGANYANQAGNLYTGIGNANAAGTVGAGNAYANGLNQLTNYASQYYWNRPGASSGGGGWGNGY